MYCKYVSGILSMIFQIQFGKFYFPSIVFDLKYLWFKLSLTLYSIHFPTLTPLPYATYTFLLCFVLRQSHFVMRLTLNILGSLGFLDSQQSSCLSSQWLGLQAWASRPGDTQSVKRVLKKQKEKSKLKNVKFK